MIACCDRTTAKVGWSGAGEEGVGVGEAAAEGAANCSRGQRRCREEKLSGRVARSEGPGERINYCFCFSFGVIEARGYTSARAWRAGGRSVISAGLTACEISRGSQGRQSRPLEVGRGSGGGGGLRENRACRRL